MNYYQQGDFSDIIELITEKFEYVGGYKQVVEARERAFANQYSAHRDEHSEGDTDTLKKRINFELHPEDYAGQELVEAQGVRYNVQRVYVNQKKRLVELHCVEVG